MLHAMLEIGQCGGHVSFLAEVRFRGGLKKTTTRDAPDATEVELRTPFPAERIDRDPKGMTLRLAGLPEGPQTGLSHNVNRHRALLLHGGTIH